ncbi:GTPase IMAP family member 7-like isoform X1 [Labeo rohita]|uniref:GTPase IMAP family member 7-like isoform X1 n=1 Tax=Labeo rohita TaxID=84645 RepID=A0A498P4Q3_LABRO|nr:GTPase IMAP family member 7-like isoform X1 [Labeo rohita]
MDLEDFKKRLKEERNMREDQQKSLEDKLKLLEEQHEDELKRRQVEWRDEYEREKDEMMKKICSETNQYNSSFIIAPRRRKQSKSPPPQMSDLRIVLLGWSVSENSHVGNFILGRAAFHSEAPPDVVEKVTGRLKDRHVIIINSPQLLQTNISDHQITQTVRECVHLSDPGPQVIVLLLKHEPCSAEDQECVEKVLLSFSERVYQHTMLLSTREPTETIDILQKIIQKCANRHFSLQTSSFLDDLLQTLEDIEKMNDGRHLDCAEASQHFTVEKQDKQKRLFDTELTNEEIQREIRHCISMILPGPHVFLLLIRMGRFTKEEEKSVKIIQETFGENSLMYTMVLFTRGDFLKKKTINECLETAGSVIKTLIETCGNRFHLFNNNQTGDQTQVSDLLEKIDNMVKANGGSYYSCKMFREMEREKQEQQIKILMDRLREREEEIKKLEEEKGRMKMMMEEERQNQDKERKRREEELNKREEQCKILMKEKEDLQSKHEEEKERMKMMMEEERQNQDKGRKRREEELKREISEQEKNQRVMRDEMRQERETFRHEIEELRKEKENVKKEKEKLQNKCDTEIERLMNKIENERKKREEYTEREEQYKTLMKEKEREMQEEMKREWEKQKLEEKTRREEEDEKRRNKEQRDWDEFNQRLKVERERMEREKEDLHSKHEEEENKMKILMEKLNREREELMKKQEEEKERMMMMKNDKIRTKREREEKRNLQEKLLNRRNIRERYKTR